MSDTLSIVIALFLFLLLCSSAALIFILLARTKNGNDDKNARDLVERLDYLKSDLADRLARTQTYSAEQTTQVLALVDEKLARSTEALNGQIEQMSRRMDVRLNEGSQNSLESTRQITERLDNAARAVGDVNKKLAELSEANRRIMDVSKGLGDLQNILSAPKLRGLLGEQFLGELLAQVLPEDRYRLQHKFKSGDIVDAAILLEQGMLCIDSKFPLENFRRLIETRSEEEKHAFNKQFISDVKKHVGDISKKYILPSEGTFDFAMMYVPAESIYYELVMKDENTSRDVLEFAREKRIVLVSPNTFYAYLQVIVMGLRGLKVEEHAHEILKTLGQMNGEFARISETFAKIGTHLRNLNSAYNETEKRIDKFSVRLESQSDRQKLEEETE